MLPPRCFIHVPFLSMASSFPPHRLVRPALHVLRVGYLRKEHCGRHCLLCTKILFFLETHIDYFPAFLEVSHSHVIKFQPMESEWNDVCHLQACPRKTSHIWPSFFPSSKWDGAPLSQANLEATYETSVPKVIVWNRNAKTPTCIRAHLLPDLESSWTIFEWKINAHVLSHYIFKSFVTIIYSGHAGLFQHLL